MTRKNRLAKFNSNDVRKTVVVYGESKTLCEVLETRRGSQWNFLRLNALTQKAAINLHISCTGLIKSRTNLTIKQLRTKLSIRTNCSEIERLDNPNHFCTFAFRMPSNGRFYIALTSHFLNIMFVTGSGAFMTAIYFKAEYWTVHLKDLILAIYSRLSMTMTNKKMRNKIYRELPCRTAKVLKVAIICRIRHLT